MNEKWNQQKLRITNISKKLRMHYYRLNRCNCYYDVPFGIDGNLTESIGPWPEFIFQGTFCKKSILGNCSACFYSQFSLKNRLTGISYERMLHKQFEYVFNNFDELVLNRQYGGPNKGFVKLALTPTGSYFDNVEFPQKLRIEMLNKLYEIAAHIQRPIQLFIESHCHDWNALDFSSKESQCELDLLRRLHAKILFGFESIDEYARNVLYNKCLSMPEITTACDSAIRNGLGVGLFIYAGLFSMNDALTITDVCDSIDFAVNRGLLPVLMFQNVQKFTIPDILLRNNKTKLLEPFTVVEIILHLISKLKSCNKADWLIADPKGGPPTPEYNIFDSAQITSIKNANEIYNMVYNLRLTQDLDSFMLKARELKSSTNYLEYKKYICSCEGRDKLEDTTDVLLSYAEQTVSNLIV